VVGAGGAGYALWAMGEAFAHRRLGVDVIALLAIIGALVVGELLAAAVISVMLASGRALEAWAAGRARHDLRALLEQAPKNARRYRGQTLETVPLDAVSPGDLLLIAPDSCQVPPGHRGTEDPGRQPGQGGRAVRPRRGAAGHLGLPGHDRERRPELQRG
jgi:cation transport ATPase